MKIYRLSKCKKLFLGFFKQYNQRKNFLNDASKELIKQVLEKMQNSLISKNNKEASKCALELEALSGKYLKRHPLIRIFISLTGLIFALLIAIVIRSIWFELYEIPSGSMRPTLKERDRLTVSKTPFGLNVPLSTGHFYFNPGDLLRNTTAVFTTADMDIPDADTLHFYLFPGKKQFVKRLVGKGGDTLYFHGGKIYGLDANNELITHELNPTYLSEIDHIPFVQFNGKMDIPKKPKSGIFEPVVIKQMNIPVAKLELENGNKPKGTLLAPNLNSMDYYDLWGFKNYGMARVLSKKQMLSMYGSQSTFDTQALLYLEITHHPSIKTPKVITTGLSRLILSVDTSATLLPLSQEHLDVLMSHLYTARFTIKNGKAYSYGLDSRKENINHFGISLPDIPNGTYEFYSGTAYKVYFGGVTKTLPKNHPIYDFTVEKIQAFFNLGIQFMNIYEPKSKDQFLRPPRYVYYRNGDLYAMGNILMKKNDPTLKNFITNEQIKKDNAPSYKPYIPFTYSPLPTDKNGEIDKSFIKKYGLKIDPNCYLALGDNFAMSSDSRDFGFVPQNNIRGVPEFIFWPPGNRFGSLKQPSYPFFNTRNVPMYLITAVFLTIYVARNRRNNKLPKKIE